MKLKIDENLPTEAARLLREAGFDALTVADPQLNGVDDAVIYAVCQGEQRILVTLDVGFANIQAYPPDRSTGIIILRLREQSRPAVLAAIQSAIALLELEPIDGRLWIVDEQRIRIRS